MIYLLLIRSLIFIPFYCLPGRYAHQVVKTTGNIWKLYETICNNWQSWRVCYNLYSYLPGSAKTIRDYSDAIRVLLVRTEAFS